MQYDLLLAGGEVMDPAAGPRGVMDVGIAGGKIVAVAPNLPVAQARRTISAKGRLVTPGLVDMHAHVFVNAHDMGACTAIAAAAAASPRCATPAAPAHRILPVCAMFWTRMSAPVCAPSSTCPRSASPARRAAAS